MASKIVSWGFAASVVAAMGNLGLSEAPPSAPSDPREEYARTAQTFAQIHIKERLKSPDSADFKWFPEVSFNEEAIRFVVIGTVAATKSFNAKILSEDGVTLDRVCGDAVRKCYQLVNIALNKPKIVSRQRLWA